MSFCAVAATRKPALPACLPSAAAAMESTDLSLGKEPSGSGDEGLEEEENFEEDHGGNPSGGGDGSSGGGGGRGCSSAAAAGAWDAAHDHYPYCDHASDYWSSTETHCPKCVGWRGENHFLLRVLEGELRKKEQPDAGVEQVAETMDPVLWSNLPEDILQRILAMLPLASKFRMSAVCRGWLGLMSSQEFKRLSAACAAERRAPAVVCVMDPQDVDTGKRDWLFYQKSAVADLKGMQVCRLRMTFLPEKFHQSLSTGFVQVQDGLVCIPTFRKVEDSRNAGDLVAVEVNFCVANPVTRTWKELPPEFCVLKELFGKNWGVKLLVHDGAPGQYSLVLLTLCSNTGATGQMTAKVYSSESESWQETVLEGFPHDALDDEDCEESWPQYVLCKGLLYLDGPWGIVVYDLETGKLVGSRLDEDERNCKFLRPYRVLGDDKGVYCVPEKPLQDVFGIWQLNTSTLAWHNTSFLPESMQQALLGQLRPRPELGEWMAPYRTRRRKLRLQSASLVLGDIMFLTLAVADNHYSPLSASLVAYSMQEHSWKLVVQGWRRDWLQNYRTYHLFTPSFEQ